MFELNIRVTASSEQDVFETLLDSMDGIQEVSKFHEMPSGGVLRMDAHPESEVLLMSLRTEQELDFSDHADAAKRGADWMNMQYHELDFGKNEVA